MNEDNPFGTLKGKRIIVTGLKISADDIINQNSQLIYDKRYYYNFQELLGEGAFCKVYKAIYKPTQEVIAVKVITTALIRVCR